MATLTTSYQKLGEKKLGSSYGDLYIRIYAKYNSQNVANNTSSVTYQSRLYFSGNYIIAQGQTKVITAGTSATTTTTNWQNFEGRQDGRYNNGETVVKTISATISHNNSGNASISCSAEFSSVGSWGWSGTASGSASLPTIPRKATITSATDFTDEGNPTIAFSNPGNFNLEPYINFWKNGTLALSIKRSIGKYSSPYTWNLTDNERNSIREFMSNVNSWDCNEGVTTYNGSTVLDYHSVTKKCTIVNANPIFEGFNYDDTNDTTYFLTHGGSRGSEFRYGIFFIKGYSTLQVTIPTNYKAEAQKYATMSKYKLEGVEANYSSSEEVTLPEITNYSKNTITVQAIDSRGNTKEKTYTLTNDSFIDYNLIEKGSITLTRSNSGVGEEVTLNYNGTWWNDNFGVIDNGISATYKYKKTTDTNWVIGATTINPVINDNNFSYNGQIAGDTEQHGFDIDDSYDIEVTITDALSSVTFSAILGAGKPAIAVYGNKVALGDKYDTSLGGIQLWGDIYVNGNRIS